MGLSIKEQITFFYTHDLEGTDRFYGGVLQLSAVLRQVDCVVYRVTETAFIGFCQRLTAPIEKHQILFTLVTDEVDEWYEHLLADNVPIDHPPLLNETYQIYHFFCTDPTGYKVEIQQFLDSNWHGGEKKGG